MIENNNENVNRNFKEEKFLPLSEEDVKFKNSNDYVRELFHLLPYFRYSGYPYSKETSSELLRSVHNHAENFVEHIFSTIETLGKFLTVGLADTDVGLIEKHELYGLAAHFKVLGELGKNIFNIKEHARIELAERKIKI